MAVASVVHDEGRVSLVAPGEHLVRAYPRDQGLLSPRDLSGMAPGAGEGGSHSRAGPTSAEREEAASAVGTERLQVLAPGG